MNDETTTVVEEYSAPALSELGTVTAATLGSAYNDQADDTQYYT